MELGLPASTWPLDGIDDGGTGEYRSSLNGCAALAPEPLAAYGDAPPERFETPATDGGRLRVGIKPALPLDAEATEPCDDCSVACRKGNPPVGVSDGRDPAALELAALLVLARPVEPPPTPDKARDPLPPILDVLPLSDKLRSSAKCKVSVRGVLERIGLPSIREQAKCSAQIRSAKNADSTCVSRSPRQLAEAVY
jgi:hypothetical protein